MKYIFASFIILFAACKQKPETATTWQTIQKSLQEKFISAADGDTIHIEAGNYMFTRGLQLEGKKNLVITGAGKENTILSFSNQNEGAQGILITNCYGLTIQNLTVQDARGDNLKISDTRNLTLRHIRSRWTGPPSSKNGAYALYPVLCKQVLIEYCEASGSSDAGIYVGQSDSVIIRNNKAWQNVAGIESENSRWVEIYDNEAFDNAGGLLVFDLPGLTQYGHTTHMYRNNIHDNNHENFAAPGNVVAGIPSGSGIMILATHNLEMEDNDITNNQTVGTGIISYELVAALSEGESATTSGEGAVQTVQNNFRQDSLYNPFPYDIRIHNNRYSNNHWFPTLSHDIGLVLLWKSFGAPPDIAFDGIRPDASDPLICIGENGTELSFINLDAGNEFENLSKDVSKFSCR
jgi:parallel beta-helix repeat protein